MYEHVLIATDGSDFARKAVNAGLELAKQLRARVTALYAAPNYDPPAVYSEGLSFVGQVSQNEGRERHADYARKLLENVQASAQAAGVQAELVTVVDDAPYNAIIQTAASRNCDLIVMASHGRSGLAAVLVGSTTQKVLTHSTVPVLVVR